MKKLHGMTVIGTKTTKLGAMIRVECDRCRGTGNWDPNSYRVCYKCGGRGELALDTVESTYNRKLAHIAEVRASLETNKARLAEKLAAGRPRWTWMSIENWITRDQENLTKLEAELAMMKVPS